MLEEQGCIGITLYLLHAMMKTKHIAPFSQTGKLKCISGQLPLVFPDFQESPHKIMLILFWPK